MARRLRREYPGGIYQVINRGNYRSDVFGTAGAAAALLEALQEASKRFGWRVGADVVMRNHFLLAGQTAAQFIGRDAVIAGDVCQSI